MSDTVINNVDSSIDLGSHYSRIIAPADYNQLMSHEHLYIGASDNYLKHEIAQRIADITDAEIVELGCGPGRLLPLIAQTHPRHLTLVDIDPNFITYAQEVANTLGFPANIVQSNIVTYQHTAPVDIFYSQGIHHHIAKNLTQRYLENIHEQLTPNGVYILSDEFLPDYDTEEERKINAIVWYSHVIDHASQHGFHYLAQEEAKTLIDDLFEGQPELFSYKSIDHIDLVLKAVNRINVAALKEDFSTSYQLAKQLSINLSSIIVRRPSGNETLDLSRRDFKICNKKFKEEIQQAGLVIESQRFFGLNKKIGGMIAYVLKKG